MQWVEASRFRSYGTFAFSPDSRRLAFMACPADGSGCGVFLAEIAGEPDPRFEPTTRLMKSVGENPFWLFWNPDGTQLGMVTFYDPGTGSGNEDQLSMNMEIYDIYSQDLIYSLKYPYTYDYSLDNMNNLPEGSPPVQWGVDTWSRLSSMAGCATP